ncbi:MAG: hypothetical protein L0Z51_00800 [Candidatus Latescibacteria bacterium]|nr:hypothetical protein [Candidatus Latescibacterota bacterium]
MQFELELLSIPQAKAPRVVASAVLRKHRLRNDVLRRVNYVRRFFPELEGETITVGLTRAASGMAVPGGSRIWLNPSRLSYHTIAHELIHLLQLRNLGIPSGEKACDVFSLARHWTLNDDRPSYVRVPLSVIDGSSPVGEAVSRMLYDVACDALVRRADGHRRYLAYFESEVERRSPALASRENRASVELSKSLLT